MTGQEVQDARFRLAELRRLLAMSMADEQRLYQRHTEAELEAERWRQRAQLAASKGSDDLARAALERAGRHEARSADLRLQYLDQKVRVEEMKSRLLDLESRLRSVPSRSMQTFDTARLERTLSRLHQQEVRAREQRAMLAAFAELERDEVAEKLAALEREDQLERQLAELKTRLGIGDRG